MVISHATAALTNTRLRGSAMSLRAGASSDAGSSSHHSDLYAAVPLALSEAFFVLNLLACFMHQIFELVDGPYQPVRAGFGSRREFRGAPRSGYSCSRRGSTCWCG